MTAATEQNDSDLQWFAVWTRARQEKSAAAVLHSYGVPHYLPVRSEIRQWSDRKQAVEIPLFSGYLFVRIGTARNSMLQVLKTPGIVSLVGNHTGPLPIPDQQIEDIRTVLKAGAPYSIQPTLRIGDRVRVIRGALRGVEGTLVRARSDSHLVVSIAMVRQSLAVSVSQNDVEYVCAVSPTPHAPIAELSAA